MLGVLLAMAVRFGTTLPIVASRSNSYYNGQNLDAYVEETYRTFHVAGVNCENIQLTFGNHFMDGQKDRAGMRAIVVSCSIEVNRNGNSILCSFPNGTRFATIPPGGFVTTTSTPINFAAGTPFAIRTRVQHAPGDNWNANLTRQAQSSGSLAAGTYGYRISQIVNGTETGFGFDSEGAFDHWVKVSNNSKVALTWQKSPVASSYRIYRGMVAGEEELLAVIASPATTQFVDTGTTTPSGEQPHLGWPVGLTTNAPIGDGKTNSYPLTADPTLPTYKSFTAMTTTAYSPSSIRGTVTWPRNAKSIGVIGDSIAYGSLDSVIPPLGYDAGGFISRVFTGNVGDINLSKGGATAHDWAQPASVSYRNFELRGLSDVIVQLGTNDLGKRYSAAQIEQDLTSVYAALKAKRIRVFQTTILPRINFSLNQESNRKLLNEWIRSNKAGITGYLDLGPVLETLPNSGFPKPGMFNSDGVHPNALGHATLAAAKGIVVIGTRKLDWSYFLH